MKGVEIVFVNGMQVHRLKKGLDIPLEGAPDESIEDRMDSPTVALFPREFSGIKPKPEVEEGAHVRRGDVLFTCKKTPGIQFCAPAGGTVRAVDIGHRRMIDRIVIERDDREEAVHYPQYDLDALKSASREELMDRLLETGYLAWIQQRPFSCMANPAVEPRRIFVNAMAGAPFEPAFRLALKNRENAFRAGLTALTRLTDGLVFLSVPLEDLAAYESFEDVVKLHAFGGPYPAGLTSVHMHHIAPIQPKEAVWTVRAADVLLIGELLLKGELPTERLICAGGPGIAPQDRKHYRVRLGSEVGAFLKAGLSNHSTRLISGTILRGETTPHDGHLGTHALSVTAISEVNERRFLGWLDPGLKRFSASRAFISSWLNRRPYTMNTDQNGSVRAMVATGVYERYLPMNLMVDFLIWAALAHDTDEMAELGILETEPEDFAICSYVCPSKLDLVGIIRQGLEDIEEEGVLVP